MYSVRSISPARAPACTFQLHLTHEHCVSRVCSVHLGLLMYMYRLALAEMPEGERLKADSEFKPNLVNSVTYMVEALIQVCVRVCGCVDVGTICLYDLCVLFCLSVVGCDLCGLSVIWHDIGRSFRRAMPPPPTTHTQLLTYTCTHAAVHVYCELHMSPLQQWHRWEYRQYCAHARAHLRTNVYARSCPHSPSTTWATPSTTTSLRTE